MTHLRELPVEWDYAGPENYYPAEAASFLKFLCATVFDEYEPSQFKPFESKLVRWLNNLDSEKKQKAMIALLLDVFFMGPKEFQSLYRYLANSIIPNWIIDEENIDLFDDEVTELVDEKVNSSWICPITDSLRINAFLKVNNLVTADIRPDWRSLKRLGDTKKIKTFVTKNKIKHLMLIEDFVGSGTQVKNVAKFASETLPNVKILIAPLVVCPDGNDVLKRRILPLENVTYAPALVLPDSTKFPKKEDAVIELHKFMHKIFDEIKGRFVFGKDETITGYKSTGAQVVMYSNCPNNTLPIYHQETKDWDSLFPRIRRQ